MPSDSSSHKLALREKIGYSLGDLAANFVFQSQIMFLSYFYTEVFGITAATVGTLLLITRLWHAVIDPMMGAIADRTNTRWGRFRPWVLWTAVPFGVLFVLTYTTPNLDDRGKLAWAYTTYILLMLVYTINNIPYSAMTGVLTGDSNERTSLAQWRFIAAMTAAFLVQSFTPTLVEKFGGGSPQVGYQLTMGLWAVIAVISFVICFATTKERVHPDPSQFAGTDDIADIRAKAHWWGVALLGIAIGGLMLFKSSEWVTGIQLEGWRYWAALIAVRAFAIAIIFAPLWFALPASAQRDIVDLFRNGPWWALIILTLFTFINLAMRGSATPYYFKFVVGNEKLLGWFNGLGLATTIIGVILSKSLAMRFGKRNTFIVCLFLSACFILAFVLIPRNAVWAIMTCQVLYNLSYGPTIPLLWAMMADVADCGEWKTGRRATGMVFATMMFGLNSGLAFGGAATGWLLSWYGYVEQATEQAERATQGIVWIFSVYSAAAFFVGVIALLFYKIDKHMEHNIAAELTTRREKFVSTENL